MKTEIKTIHTKSKNKINFTFLKIFLLSILVLFTLIIYTFSEKKNKNKKKGIWKKYELNPVLGDKKIGTVFDPYLIQENDLFKMYVSWRERGNIALSTSSDGLNWSELRVVLERGKKNTWEERINRADVIEKGGKYYMWYTGQYQQVSKIGYAYSNDSLNFQRISYPILVPEFKYEKDSVMNPKVIYDKEERIFKMWYSAGETYEPDVIGYATSIDGINWKKYENNPIFTANNNKSALDSYKVGGCDIHKISKNHYLMFYIGYSDLNTARIFIAESKDGITNWIRREKPIIMPTKGNFDSNACYKPAALYDKKNKRWMLWYNGRHYTEEFIGLAIYNGFNI